MKRLQHGKKVRNRLTMPKQRNYLTTEHILAINQSESLLCFVHILCVHSSPSFVTGKSKLIFFPYGSLSIAQLAKNTEKISLYHLLHSFQSIMHVCLCQQHTLLSKYALSYWWNEPCVLSSSLLLSKTNVILYWTRQNFWFGLFCIRHWVQS